MANYYNEKNLAKFNAALHEAVKAVKIADVPMVKISNANSKMGAVASVSTLPFITCPKLCKGTCGANCYAAKLAAIRPSVLASYAWNTAMAIYRPTEYWNGIDTACKAVRYFRFHVSGDILNADYFAHMIETARNNSKTEILVFTKRYNVVNEWIANNGDLPENLHILFSEWTNLTAENPYNLPTTNVIPKGEEPKENWKICGGNCFNCACRGVGCWNANKGETVAFPIH